jgi:TonB-linked SusC/RagA family outer membrane protein
MNEMIKYTIKKLNLSIILLLILLFNIGNVFAQKELVDVTGNVYESGTGLPLRQVSVSVAASGILFDTNEKGEFTIKVPDLKSELVFDLPGYVKQNVYLSGIDKLVVYMVPTQFKSKDQVFNSPGGIKNLKDAVGSTTSVNANELQFSSASSFDNTLQGLVPGLNITSSSGMPGSLSWLNIGGVSSMYCRNEPLLFIDGMIFDYNYASEGIMEGFSLNPLDLVDYQDISDIAVIKNGNSYLGSLSSNGVIYLNTEQKNEASTVIQISAYGGIGLMPQKLDVMNSSQFKQYFSGRLAEEGLSSGMIDQKYPWLNGQPGSKEYYRYNQKTDWQDEVFSPGALSKFHIFLKGGDDIATYNISAGYINQQSVYEGSKYSRFNLRINGKINITDKFSITPNVKLSLSDSYSPNQGPSVFKNPLISGLLIPSILQPFATDEKTGESLGYFDNESSFNISNPVAIITNAQGTNRNYNFLSSVKAQYKISESLSLNNILGISFNNARENIFLPDLGLVQIDSAANSPQVFINEFRSTQDFATIEYNKKNRNGHSIDAQAGFRFIMNSYKTNRAVSLNTPSDDFKTLGSGAKYNYLRTSTGGNHKLNIISYFANVDYSFRNKYYLNLNASYDGNSSINANNRYNFYPSAGLAWRLSSEKFLSNQRWLNDLRLRANWSVGGNVYSSIYDYSKLYYGEERVETYGVPVRESIPNPNLEIEKKMTVNGGLDISLFKQTTTIHLDYFQSRVDNLVIQQELPSSYGYTEYFDNGGKLSTTGFEIGADQRIHFGKAVLRIGATLSNQKQNIEALTFIKKSQDKIITKTFDAEYVTMVGSPINSFWGFKTDGIFQTDEEASQYVGVKGENLKAGDIRFVDLDGNKVIDDYDKMIIGDPNPDFFGGINTALTFGRFELSANFYYSVGNDIFNYVRSKAEGMDTYGNQFTSVLDRWSTSNQSSVIPRAAIGDPSGNNSFSDRWIEDGSFISLKKLTISYLLPQTSFYKGVTLFVTGSNLFTSTKYSGYDPEFMYSNSPFYMGIDNGKIPHGRTFIVGIKLDL